MLVAGTLTNVRNFDTPRSSTGRTRRLSIYEPEFESPSGDQEGKAMFKHYTNKEKKFLVMLIVAAIGGSGIGIYLGLLTIDLCPMFECITRWIF